VVSSELRFKNTKWKNYRKDERSDLK